jgi:hypothetical protein
MSTKLLQLRSLTSWSRSISILNGKQQQLHSSLNKVTPRSFSVVGAASASDQHRDRFSTAALASLVAFGGTGAVVLCEQKKEKATKEVHPHPTPSEVANEDFEKYEESVDLDSMPIYTSDQVSEHDGQDGKSMWMSYGGVVYDVTDFIANHPGGWQLISTAAGMFMLTWMTWLTRDHS